LAGLGCAVAILLTQLKILPHSFDGDDAMHDQTPAKAAPEEPVKGKGAKDKAAPATAAADESRPPPPPILSRTAPSLLAAAGFLAIIAVLVAVGQGRIAAVATPVAGVVAFLLGVLPRDAGAPDETDAVVEEVNDPRSRREMVKEMAF